MSFKRKGTRRLSYNPNKMDITKAQGLLGFSSNRWMDASSGVDPKSVLDKALDDQMQKLNQKRAAKIAAKDKIGADRLTRGTKKPEPKLSNVCDEYMVLHEAYQFLLQRYNNPKQRGSKAKDADGEQDDASINEVLFGQLSF